MTILVQHISGNSLILFCDVCCWAANSLTEDGLLVHQTHDCDGLRTVTGGAGHLRAGYPAPIISQVPVYRCLSCGNLFTEKKAHYLVDRVVCVAAEGWFSIDQKERK